MRENFERVQLSKLLKTYCTAETLALVLSRALLVGADADAVALQVPELKHAPSH